MQAKGGFLADLVDAVHVVDLKSSRTLFAIPGLASYLRKRRPAVIVAALEYVNVAAIVAGRLSCTGTPVISAVHTPLATVGQRWPGLRGALFGYCVNWSYRRARAVVCVSQGVADGIIRVAGVGPERVRVIYNPVIPPDIRELARQPVEHPWFAPPANSQTPGASQTPACPQTDSRILLAVGRLMLQKDYPTLLQALKVVRRHHDARLMILGEGEQRPRLESLVKELCLESYVSLPGIVKNPYAYMARADLFVMSSAWEALPTVLIEALAVGAPVVATDCVSGPRRSCRTGAMAPWRRSATSRPWRRPCRPHCRPHARNFPRKRCSPIPSITL